ncbi:MAG: hypothetical protein UY68_C0021G0001, partial [Parcubacteria group bacterium GW2011_GWF2_52_12]
KLLRVLEDNIVERLGGQKGIEVDIRIISATNINFNESIEKGSFREDLFYRLNVFPINIPPLRERKSDIPLLLPLSEYTGDNAAMIAAAGYLHANEPSAADLEAHGTLSL